MKQNEGALTVHVAVIEGPHAGSSVKWVGPGSFRIGRGANADLSLPHDLTVSVDHCRVDVTEHGCVVQDLGGRHGTVVNGRSSTRALLQSGDTIGVGMSLLRLTISSERDYEPTLIRRASWSAGGATVAVLAGSAASTHLLDIPGYSIRRKLGQGGMGVVYEATQARDGARVAIKTIAPAPGAGQRAVLLFQREMELLAQLAHPRIVRFLDSGQHAGQIYLVMEYVETIDLPAVVACLSRDKQIAIYTGIICHVLEGLQFAHERKLVHRDVKPGNILVSREGKRLHARLADFGLAKNFEKAGLSQLTADNEIRGTPAFMPWEQLQDSRYAKPSVDIYAAAATLHFYLTGRAPGHTSEFAQNPELSDLPAGLAVILRRALDADPRRRYGTADEMQASLHEFVRQTAMI